MNITKPWQVTGLLTCKQLFKGNNSTDGIVLLLQSTVLAQLDFNVHAITAAAGFVAAAGTASQLFIGQLQPTAAGSGAADAAQVCRNVHRAGCDEPFTLWPISRWVSSVHLSGKDQEPKDEGTGVSDSL